MAGFVSRKIQSLKISGRVLTYCMAGLFFCKMGLCAPVSTDEAPQRSIQEKQKLVQQAVDHYEKNEIAEAQNGLEQAQSEFPENYAVPYYLGLIYLEQGETQKAIAQWQKYVRMDPQSENAQNIRKNITLLLRKHAREFAKQAVADEAALTDEGQVDDKTIAVTNFRNLGSDHLGPVGKGMAAMLITDLSHVPDLQVVDRIKLHALLEEMKLGASDLVNPKTIPRVGKLLKAGHVATGSLADLEKENLIIASALMETGQKASVGAQEAKGALKQFYDLEKKIACQIVEDLGFDCKTMPKNFNAIHTKSVPALTAYSKGLVYFDEEKYDESREMFQDALEHDPQFELAAVALLATPTSAMILMSTSQMISSVSSSGPSSGAGVAVVNTSGPSTAGMSVTKSATASTTATTTTAGTTTAATTGGGIFGLSPVTAIVGGAAIVGGGLALAGGGGGGGGGDDPPGPGPDPGSDKISPLTGDWKGSWIDDNGTSGEATFSLKQDKETITGRFVLTDSECITEGRITGSFSNLSANLTVQSGEEAIKLDANLDKSAKKLNGTWSYTASASDCEGHTGRFTTDLASGSAGVEW